MTRILLIEDNELNRDMLRRRLERRGYAVIVAADGAGGLAAANAGRPDLVLMDIRLPDMDGRDLARALKAGQATRGIPLIALTAHAMEGDRAAALQAGCDEYATKPVDLPRLLGLIEAQLSRKPARRITPSPGTPGEGGGGGRATDISPRSPLPNPPPEYRGRGKKPR